MRPTIATLIERQRTNGTPPRGRAGRPARGFSLLEVQVAFCILGIALTGLCQLVVMQLRQVRVLEKRLQGQVVQYNWSGSTSQTMLTAQTYYLVPWQNPLTQKLAGAAQVVGSSTIPCDPGPLTVPSSAPQSYPVNVVELDVTASSQNVTVYVDVSRAVIGLETAEETRIEQVKRAAMKPAVRVDARRCRAGISVTEMVVATGLATLLMMLLATTWASFGRPALEVEARARIEQEGILATQSLAYDFGGFLADTPGRKGTMNVGSQSPYQFNGWDSSTPGVLLLNFYGANLSDAIAISYQLQGNVLMRTNSSTGVSTAVARYVTAFSAAGVPDNLNQVQITITIAYRNFTTTFTLVGVSPS